MLHMKTSASHARCAHVYTLRRPDTSSPASPPREHGLNRRDRCESYLANLILGVSGMLICLLGFWAVMGMLRLGVGLGGWLTGGLSL